VARRYHRTVTVDAAFAPGDGPAGGRLRGDATPVEHAATPDAGTAEAATPDPAAGDDAVPFVERRSDRSPGRRIRGLEPEERRQERRRQLLDSAFDLFATQGYARTTIEQICQGAYVGFKGFYDEFATKEALFLALSDELVGEVRRSVVQAAAGRSLDDELRPVLEAFVRSVLDDRRVAQILFVEAAGLSPAVEAYRRATYRAFADDLHGLYIATAPLRDLEPPAGMVAGRITLGLVGAVVELLVDWLVDPEADALERLIDDLEIYCRVLLTGLDASWPRRHAP
jgi:AcrR family transcriptional regulator